jgi:hypothetical protein
MTMNAQTQPPNVADAAAEDRLAVAIAEIARQSPERTALVAGAGGFSPPAARVLHRSSTSRCMA